MSLTQASTTQLLIALEDRTKKLLEAYTELAFHKSEELRHKLEAWKSHPEESQSYRDRLAQINSSHDTQQTFELDALIKGLTDEKYLILTILQYTPPSHRASTQP